MLAAVEQNRYKIQNASDELCEDREIVLAVVQPCVDFFKYACAAVRSCGADAS